MSLAAVLLTAGLVTCADLGPASLDGLAAKDSRVMLHLEKVSLDRVLKSLGRIGGFKTTFHGYTPKVDAHYQDRSMGQVLEELASRHGLAYRLVEPGILEVQAPLLSGLDGVTEPRPTQKVDPVFPKEAREAQGKVVLSAVICEDGRVGALHVLEAPLELVFRDAAMDAVRRWVYEPATRQGKPVPAYLTVVVEFKGRPQ